MIPRKSLPVRSSSAQPRLPDIEPDKKKNISETKYKGDYEFLIHVDSPPPAQQEAWPSPLNLPPLDSEKLSPVSSGKSSRRNWAPQIEDEDVYQRLNYMEHLVETRTQELNRLRKEIDNIKMSTHRRQMVMRYPEEKTPHKDGETYMKHGLDLERLKKDKKVLSDLLKQSQRELTRKDSVVHQLNQENNRLRREAVLWETRFSDVGEKEAQINQLKEELEVVREEVACLHAEKESRMQMWQNDFENIGINSKGMSYSRGDNVENNNLKILLIDNQNFEKCFSYLLSKLSPDHEYFMRWNSVSNFNVLGQTSLEKLFERHLGVDLDELTRQFEEFWNEQELLKKDLKQANAKIESQESTVEMLTQENEGMRQNLVTMEAKDSFINELTIMNEKLKKELEDTERKFEILSKAKENLEEDVNNTQDRIQTLQKELSVLKAEKKNSIEETKVDVEKVEDRSSKNYKQYETNTSEEMSPRHQFEAFYTDVLEAVKLVLDMELPEKGMTPEALRQVIVDIAEECSILKQDLVALETIKKTEEENTEKLMSYVTDTEVTLEKEGRSVATLRAAIYHMDVVVSVANPLGLGDTILDIYKGQLKWLEKLETQLLTSGLMDDNDPTGIMGYLQRTARKKMNTEETEFGKATVLQNTSEMTSFYTASFVQPQANESEGSDEKDVTTVKRCSMNEQNKNSDTAEGASSHSYVLEPEVEQLDKDLGQHLEQTIEIREDEKAAHTEILGSDTNSAPAADEFFYGREVLNRLSFSDSDSCLTLSGPSSIERGSKQRHCAEGNSSSEDDDVSPGAKAAQEIFFSLENAGWQNVDDDLLATIRNKEPHTPGESDSKKEINTEPLQVHEKARVVVLEDVKAESEESDVIHKKQEKEAGENNMLNSVENKDLPVFHKESHDRNNELFEIQVSQKSVNYGLDSGDKNIEFFNEDKTEENSNIKLWEEGKPENNQNIEIFQQSIAEENEIYQPSRDEKFESDEKIKMLGEDKSADEEINELFEEEDKKDLELLNDEANKLPSEEKIENNQILLEDNELLGEENLEKNEIPKSKIKEARKDESFGEVNSENCESIEVLEEDGTNKIPEENTKDDSNTEIIVENKIDKDGIKELCKEKNLGEEEINRMVSPDEDKLSELNKEEKHENVNMLEENRFDRSEINDVLGEERSKNNLNTEMLKYQKEENNEECVKVNYDKNEDFVILGEDKNEKDKADELPTEEKDGKSKNNEMFKEDKTDKNEGKELCREENTNKYENTGILTVDIFVEDKLSELCKKEKLHHVNMLGKDIIDKNKIDEVFWKEKSESNQYSEMLKYQVEEEDNNKACVEENSNRKEEVENLEEDKNKKDRTDYSSVEENDGKGKISEMFTEVKTKEDGIFKTQKEMNREIQLLEENKTRSDDIIESSKEENINLLKKCETVENSFNESFEEEEIEIDRGIKTHELDESKENTNITMLDEEKSQKNKSFDVIKEVEDENTENIYYKTEKNESENPNNESCKLFVENKTKEDDNGECPEDSEIIKNEINKLPGKEHFGEFESKALVKKEIEVNKNSILQEEETAENKGIYKGLTGDHSGNNKTGIDSQGVDLFEDTSEKEECMFIQSSFTVADANENVQELQMVEDDIGSELQEEIILETTNNELTHISTDDNEATYSKNKTDEVEIVSDEKTKPTKQFNCKDKMDFSRIDDQTYEDNVEQTLNDKSYSCGSTEKTFSVKASVNDLSISDTCNYEGIVVLDQNNDEPASKRTLENKEDEELSYKKEHCEKCDDEDVSVTQTCILQEQDNVKSTESTTQNWPHEHEAPHLTEYDIQQDDITDESDTLLDIENSTENEVMDLKKDEILKVVGSEELQPIEKAHVGHIKSYEEHSVDAVKEGPCLRSVIDQDCPADEIRESERNSKSGDQIFIFDDLKSPERRTEENVNLQVINGAAANDSGLSFSLVSGSDHSVGKFNQETVSNSTIIPAETEYAIELDEELIKKHYEDMNTEDLLDLRDMMKDLSIEKKQASVEEEDIIKIDTYKLGINALEEPFDDQPVYLQQYSEVQVEDNLIHQQDLEVEVEDHSLHRQDSEVQAEDYSLHRQDSEVQVEDYSLHRQDSEIQVEDHPVHRKDSEVQVENEIQNSLQERVQELETIVNEMQEVEQQHMTVACEMAEQLDQLKQREAKLKKELEAKEQARKTEISPKEQSNSQKCYLDELAAWKENVELQNSVLQKLRVELDLGQQQLDAKEKEVGALQNEIKELHHRMNQLKEGICLDNDETQFIRNSNTFKEEQLLKTIEKLRTERSMYRHQLEIQQKVARDVRSQLDSTASRLVSLKTEAAARYHKIVDHQRDMIQKKERQIKRLKTELHHVSCDLHEKVVLLDRQKRDIREMNNQLVNSEKELKDKTKLLEELQLQVSGGISAQTSENDCQTEEQKLSSIGTRCLSEKHLQTISNQAEELEKIRSQMKHLTGITSSQDGICEAEEEVARLQKEVVSLKAQLAELGIENGGDIKEATIQEIMNLSEHNHTYLMHNVVNFLELNLPDIHKSLKDVSLLEWQEVLQSRQRDLEHLGSELTNLKEQILTVYKQKIDDLDEALDMAKKEIKRLMVENEEKNEHIQCLRDMLQRTQESLEREHLLHSGRGQKTSKGGRDQRVPLELKNGQILALEEELNNQEKEIQRTERKLRNIECKMATTSKRMTLS